MFLNTNTGRSSIVGVCSTTFTFTSTTFPPNVNLWVYNPTAESFLTSNSLTVLDKFWMFAVVVATAVAPDGTVNSLVKATVPVAGNKSVASKAIL